MTEHTTALWAVYGHFNTSAQATLKAPYMRAYFYLFPFLLLIFFFALPSQGSGSDFLSKFIALSRSKFHTKVSVFHHIFEQQVKVTEVHRFSATIFGPVFPFASIWRDTVRSSFCLPGEIHYLPNSYLQYFPIHIYSISQFMFTVFSNSYL